MARKTIIASTFSKTLKTLVLGAAIASASLSVNASEMDSIHFLIPGGAGGGWDGTARGTGEALSKSGLVGTTSFENMSGGGGGKALGYLIENGDSQQGTLMVSSTPIIIRSLTKVFPQNFRDLTPIASIIGDYAVFAVRADSEIKTFADMVERFKADPKGLTVAGGSAPGSMDHLVPVMALQKAGVENPQQLNYIAFDAGGQALAGLLSGEVDVLSTGLSETVDLANSGEIRIIAHTGNKRVNALPDAPTLIEQGVNAEFVNWRGFFGAPGMSAELQQQYITTLEKMLETPEWEEVRARNGWTNIYNSGADFTAFLEAQEKEIGELMKSLGFL